MNKAGSKREARALKKGRSRLKMHRHFIWPGDCSFSHHQVSTPAFTKHKATLFFIINEDQKEQKKTFSATRQKNALLFLCKKETEILFS